MKSILAAFLTLTMVFLTGCNAPTSSLITALNAIADASSVAVVVTSTLASAGKLDPAVAAAVASYANGVTTAVEASITELNSSDTNPQKILVITGDFATVVAPVFGPGVSAEIITAIQAVTVTINLFLSQLNSQSVMFLATVAPSATLALAKGDKAMMKKIEIKCVGVKSMTNALLKPAF